MRRSFARLEAERAPLVPARRGPPLWSQSKRVLGALFLCALALGSGCQLRQGQTPTPEPTPIPTLAGLPSEVVGATPSAFPQDELSGELSIWMDWPAEETQLLSAALADFIARHPDVSVNLRYIPPAEFLEVLREQSALPGGPGLILATSKWGVDLFDRGLIQDVGPRISPELRQQLVPLAWTQVEEGDRVLGVPLELQGTVLLRNPRLAPDRSVSVEKLVGESAARRAEGHPGLVLDLGMAASFPFMAACGGTLMRIDQEFALDREVGICWLELLQQMAGAARVETNNDADLNLFRQGQSPWLVESTETLAGLQSELGEESVVLDPWPAFESTGGELSGYTWTQNAYLRSGLPQDDADVTWAFLQFILSPEWQVKRSEVAGRIHVPVVEDPGVLTERVRAVRQQLLANTPYPLGRNLEPLVAALERAARLVAEQAGDPAKSWERVEETLRIGALPPSP
jgi:ABC-type glycerol-3-phosphate transport system substrate-binding protein